MRKKDDSKSGANASAQGAYRHQRVEASILDELRSILRDEVTDPRLDAVRLTAIVLSPDSKVAKVHFVMARSEEPEQQPGQAREEVQAALTRATGFIRSRLAEGVDLKRTPDLRFIFESEVAPSAIDAIDKDGAPNSVTPPSLPAK